MSDWQKGNLALCVNDRVIDPRNPHNNSLRNIRQGAVYVVAGLTHCGLILEEAWSSHPSGGYCRDRFRKIRPLSNEETREFIADLQDGKPVPVEV